MSRRPRSPTGSATAASSRSTPASTPSATNSAPPRQGHGRRPGLRRPSPAEPRLRGGPLGRPHLAGPARGHRAAGPPPPRHPHPPHRDPHPHGHPPPPQHPRHQPVPHHPRHPDPPDRQTARPRRQRAPPPEAPPRHRARPPPRGVTPGRQPHRPHAEPHALGQGGEFLAFCRDARPPRPRTNVKLFGNEVDALFEAEKVIVEIDDWSTHRSYKSFESDRKRDAVAAEHGYLTVRVTSRRAATTRTAQAASLQQDPGRRRQNGNS